MTWLVTALGFARQVPWWVYGIAAVLAAWGADRTLQYRQGYREGVESVETRLRDAEAEALKKAAIAARKADEAGEQRALVEAETRAADLKAIERAEAEGGNALDSLF
jgi:hypothetical protein